MGNGASAGTAIGTAVGGIPGMIVGNLTGRFVDWVVTEDCWNCGTDNGRHRTYCRRCGKRL